jgi:hypothetical protein
MYNKGCDALALANMYADVHFRITILKIFVRAKFCLAEPVVTVTQISYHCLHRFQHRAARLCGHNK